MVTYLNTNLDQRTAVALLRCMTPTAFNTTLCSKNIPPLVCYNIDIHEAILTSFGRNVNKEVRDQKMLCSSSSSQAAR